MAVIVLNIPNVKGESTVAGKVDQVDAVALRETIEVSVPQSSGQSSASRTVGQSRHSDIELVRVKDRASPKLAEACSAGTLLGQVTVSLFRTLEGKGLVEYMTYTLADTYVSRIEHDTLDGNGIAYMPHFVGRSVVGPPSSLGLASVVAPLTRSQTAAVRVATRPAVAGVRGSPGNLEIERVWFNASQVSWRYVPYLQGLPQGPIEKAWNIQQGATA